MASHFSTYARPTAGAAFNPTHSHKPSFILTIEPQTHMKSFVARVSSGGDSYLDMWKRAVERERHSTKFLQMTEKSAAEEVGGDGGERPGELEKKSIEFQKILEASTEERDRIQRMQVIDRAAAAIAAASALVKERSLPVEMDSDGLVGDYGGFSLGGNTGIFLPESGATGTGTPGPNFWSWTPPTDNQKIDSEGGIDLKSAQRKQPTSFVKPGPVLELERYGDYMSLSFESKLASDYNKSSLPPLQSLMEVEKEGLSTSILDSQHLAEQVKLGDLYATHGADVARALSEVDRELDEGIYTDGAKWWKETGIEQRPDGVVCKWTLTRGVSADKTIEWEEKYWEAADEFDYKELGSEKSGRDASGSVWREYWKESMYKIDGCLHIEKSADKWGKNGKGDEWQEKWFEHYGAGEAEKWAHKWCSIDPTTELDAGHAHVWNERWGEKYDGHGGSTKYTDKWAERCEGNNGWTKWGDKWDEHFDQNGHGLKQGEAWWEGHNRERWNRTWGERHNGSGWVHKYGKSSSGEHWDTNVAEDTWYERYPHYGFYHCFENSVPLRQVERPSEWS